MIRMDGETMNYYLAVDIGASGGRHILGSVQNGRLITEEVYRFPNGMTDKDGEKVWDTDRLFTEIKAGMKECAKIGKIPVSMGIDTWGVDFVLLDKDGNRLGNAVAYRDSRTNGMDEEVYKYLSEEELYARNGIQKQLFNTVYQLMALKKKRPEQLEEADSLLMIPDYLHFLLTGVKKQEYTNATTGQLIDPKTFGWDFELIEKLGYPKKIFGKITEPGTLLGQLSPEVEKEVGFPCKVVLPPTHDTASAVVAVPADTDDVLYISSGTWSLMGTERKGADTGANSRACNFTNEGGYEHRYRYLKNIMGLWMIQSVKAELAPDMSYAELCEKAAKSKIQSLVNANDSRFLAPESMTKEVQKACRESGQQVPEGAADTAAVIYNSLARCYADTLAEIEGITGRHYSRINIVGGGSNADYLNRLTAKACGRTVCAGPSEATAIGNLSVQMIAAGEIKDLAAARKLIYDSTKINVYEP